ncbi:MAG: lysophospholipid acyltransferase family protein [Flavobacteriales bacterium]
MRSTQPHQHLDRPTVASDAERRNTLAKWLFAPFRIVFKLWFVSVFFFSMVLLYIPFKLMLRRPSGYPFAFRLMRRWGSFLNYALLVPLKVERHGELPPPPYVICVNHSSYLDIIHTFNLVPDYFLFMGKYELLKWPLFRIFFVDMHIAVNRGNRTEAARALMKAASAIGRGISISIFPEGTIPSTAPRMKLFKDGAFKLAIDKQVPVVPITFVDNWRLFGDPEKLLSRGRPGIARAVIHAAIPTVGMGSAEVDTLRRRVFDAIEAPLRADTDRIR